MGGTKRLFRRTHIRVSRYSKEPDRKYHSLLLARVICGCIFGPDRIESAALYAHRKAFAAVEGCDLVPVNHGLSRPRILQIPNFSSVQINNDISL